MNDLQIFENPEFGQVRTVEIDGTPWLVGKDVAVALGYKEPTKAVRDKVDPEDRGMSKMNHSRHLPADSVLEAAGTVPQLRLPRSGSGRVHRHWPGHHERQDAGTQPVDQHGDHCNV